MSFQRRVKPEADESAAGDSGEHRDEQSVKRSLKVTSNLIICVIIHHDMGVREETTGLLREGHSPKEIARIKRVNINTTLAYLDELVGRGALRRSDIFFSISKEIRNDYQENISNADNEDILVIRKYGNARTALGDMYEDIRDIETYLHLSIRSALIVAYGEGETGWWRMGIPVTIRQNCQSRREAEDEPVTDPYCYTDLLDLWQILDKQWKVFKKCISQRRNI